MKNRLFSLLVLAASPAYCDTLDNTDGLNIGTGNDVATGTKSAAIGENNTADPFSIVVGGNNLASDYSAAFGVDNVAYYGSLAGGVGCISPTSTTASFLFGENNWLYAGYASSMLGIGNNINRILPNLGPSGGFETGSFVAGAYNAIQQGSSRYGTGNIVLGCENAISTLSGGDSDVSGTVLIGIRNRTSKSQAWAIGEGNVAQTGTVTLGTYATQVANASLIVGNGTDFGTTSNAFVILKDGTVKIPAGKLQLGTEDPLTPTFGTGAVRTSGAMLAIGTGATSEGTGSIAIGYMAISGGAQSVALGNSTAYGVGSLAAGYNATALSESATSLGKSSFAYEESSLALGHLAGAFGFGSAAIGYQAGANGIQSFATTGGQAIGEYSIAIGQGSLANANSAVCIGGGTADGVLSFAATYGIASGDGSIAISGGEASGYGSIALGGQDVVEGANEAPAYRSTAIGGLMNVASGQLSFASGFYTRADSLGTVALGSLNKGGGTEDDWVETESLFELGNGYPEAPLTSPRSNAITTLKNGRTTLTNKFWSSSEETEIPTNATESSNGQALVVEGHTQMKGNATVNGDTVLNGKVILAEAQGDISMGIYGD